MSDNEAYIYDWVRTPRGRGKSDGALHPLKPIELLKQLLIALQQRTQVDTKLIDDVILGCVTAVGDQGANIARSALLFAGWQQGTAGFTLNRFCASGLETCNIAAAKIMSGFEQAIVAGGVESMSRHPICEDGGSWYIDPEVNRELLFVPQGISADIIATLENFSRHELDSYACDSHHRAQHATVEGYFKRSLVPCYDRNGELLLDKDETVRATCSIATMSNLKPSFAAMSNLGFISHVQTRYPQLDQIQHLHHAGNSSGIVDGAALMLIGSRKFGEASGLKPRARIISMASVGSEPVIMLTGNAAASRKALANINLQPQDIDLYEVNEAFAAVALQYLRTMAIDTEQTNVNGGAIALGHPLGATGTMVLGTLLDELERRELARGLATFCAGAGMATTTIIERV
ncbi:MAG: acetyl-CoA C-acetyltransferase [Pseudomonadota bacterium]|nr:acetyl-CoA C-acetyltransferase [Pseudomonadota bacterium]